MIPKFRAWDKPNKIMLDVIAINFSLREIAADIETRKIYPELDYWWKETDIPFSEIELMQSTGLFDKNGVEIFEGDIVRAWSEGIQGTFQIKRRIDGLWLLYPAWKDSMFWYLRPTDDGRESCEIIGNVYENPELLE